MLVVLPFENLGPPEDAYFAAGITEEITSRLARVSGLGVTSRTTATQYDRAGKTMQDIGEDLGVGFVLEGTVRWDRGAQLYELLCESCHGVDGSGGGRVSDLLATSPGDLAAPEDEAFFSAHAQQEIVRRGSPGTPMIAWGETLQEPDLQAVFKYVASLRRVDRSGR